MRFLRKYYARDMFGNISRRWFTDIVLFSISVKVFRVSLSGEVSEKILRKRYVREYFPALVYDQGLYFSIPLNAFILSQSALNVTLKMSIPF